MIKPPCEVLDWDSEFFGFRIARLFGTPHSKLEMCHILDWCAAERVRCLYYLVPSDDVEATRFAEEHQFAFVDIRMTLERKPDCSSVPGPAIRPVRKEDVPALVAIARSAHMGSRFYCDLGFSREKCDKLYQSWIENSCNGYATCVLVAQLGSQPAGYITCHCDGAVGQIGLVAVADWARGAGLGRQLVNSSLEFFQLSGMKCVRVVTQGRNISAQRLYQRCGFITSSLDLWYHRWFAQD